MSTKYVIHQEPGIDSSLLLMQEDEGPVICLGQSVNSGYGAVTDIGLHIVSGDTIEVQFEPTVANTKSGKVLIVPPKRFYVEPKPLGNFPN